MGKRGKVDDEEDKLPFSTIKKREVADSEFGIHEYEQTPLKDMDYEDILNIIKENEMIQKKIINDPILRERLIEKFSKMRHSSSDQTLPHSFYSSKYDDRNTQANTAKYRTPYKSDEGREESPRFTQFSKSDLFGRDGTIYDKGEVFERNRRDVEDQEEYEDKVSEFNTKDKEKKESYNISNFSFKQDKLKERKHESSVHIHGRRNVSSAVELDDNTNELLGEGEQKIQNTENIDHPEFPSMQTNEDQFVNSKFSKSKIEDVSQKNSKYLRKEQSYSSGKQEALTKEKIDIENNDNQLIHDTFERFNEYESNREEYGRLASVDRPSQNKQTMRSLNKKFTESKIHNKEYDKLRDYEESGVLPKQKSKSKYLYQKEENDEEILNEDQLNTFIGRHRSYKDEDIVDQSRWNLAIRDRLKKRSMKVRQILLSSRDSTDKLDQSNSDSQKHHKSKESFEELDASNEEQKKEASQFKTENKRKFNKDIKPERMRRVTTPIENKLLSNEQAKRSSIDDIMNRHKYLNPQVYIKSNLGESESKELS